MIYLVPVADLGTIADKCNSSITRKILSKFGLIKKLNMTFISGPKIKRDHPLI